MPRPRGGDWIEDELKAWRSAGVDVVVSLLTPDEIAELDLTGEEKQSAANGVEYRNLPIADRGVPTSKAAFLKLATNIAADFAAGKNVAVHCRQGLGRAPLVAIVVLVLLGSDLDAATAAVRDARGCPVPETTEQKRWIADLVRDLPIAAPK